MNVIEMFIKHGFLAPVQHEMNLQDHAELMSIIETFTNRRANHKSNSFPSELECLLKFIDSRPYGREERSLATGIAFIGPCVCINTKLLKTIIGRCKSSINNGLHQLGYVSLKNKSKTRSILMTMLPSLSNSPTKLRQWSVRCATSEAKCCFYSKCRSPIINTITPEDCLDIPKQKIPSPPQPSYCAFTAPTPLPCVQLSNYSAQPPRPISRPLPIPIVNKPIIIEPPVLDLSFVQSNEDSYDFKPIDFLNNNISFIGEDNLSGFNDKFSHCDDLWNPFE